VPLLFVQGEQETLFGGVIWSGAWRVTVDRLGDSLWLKAEFPAVALTTSSERSVEFPHSFFGVADPRPGSESRALNRFVQLGLRAGRPIWPLVTYNTWFPYGSRINESSVAEEIVRAAGLGVEIFVLDAGWYEDAGIDEQYDFTSGLGSWRVDRQRFEHGLTVLSDLAHEHGMKFGLWVEPERIALSTINQAGLADQEWLATQDGAYGDSRSAQLCLASVAAQEWVFDKLVSLIDQVRPDYLKWDNNFWINCNREGHGHGTEDSSYSHVVTLYGLLAKLRHRYPEMIVENVSGGGNRLDYGMLALTDVGWMDDRSEPSVRVRHNFQGLALAFPPAYLLSFVIDSEMEPLGSTADFKQIARSRMPGVLGFTYRYQQLDARLSGQIRESIANYKDVREIISRSYAVMLSGQAPVGNGWDVMEEIADDRRSAVIFAFTSAPGEGGTVVRPVDLVPELFYDVRSFDSGHLGKLTGAELMSGGIHVVHLESSSRAHVITLSPAPAP
jgi:alpha-galactosidase